MSTTGQIHFLRSRAAQLKAALADAQDFGLRTDSLEESLEQAQEELVELEQEQREKDLLSHFNLGHRDGLAGLGAECTEEDVEWLQEQGRDDEAEENAEYLRGYYAGSSIVERFPTARVESLECLLEEWQSQPDGHPGKERNVQRLQETLKKAKARLSSESRALLAG